MSESNNSLYHYGVLGMRWGVRRYQSKTGVIKSTREKYKKDKAAATSKEEKKKAKENFKEARRKSRVEAANKLYSKNDKKVNEVVASTSLGKLYAQRYLMGEYGALKYHQARAQGAGRAKAAVKACLADMGNTLLFNIPSVVEWRKNVRARSNEE